VGSTLESYVPEDDFGSHAFIDAVGNRFVITARLDRTGGDRAGAVRVYDANSDGSFSQIGDTFYGGSEHEIRGTISKDGRRIAIGAPYYGESEKDEQNNFGRVRVYELRSGEWSQVGDTILGEEGKDRAGYSVALSYSGDVVAIGCTHANDRRGEVRVYHLDDDEWEKVGKNIAGAGVFDKSGWTLELSDDGDVVVIGSQNNNKAGIATGHFRVFHYQGSDWVKRGQDLEGESVGDICGRFVSLSGDGMTVSGSSWFSDQNGVDSGHVRVFKLESGGLWVQKGKSIMGDGPGATLRMNCLSASGNRIAVGSGAHGYALVLDYDEEIDDWVPVGGKISGKSPNEGFGGILSLSADGNRLLVSGKEGLAEGSPGLVRLYELQGV